MTHNKILSVFKGRKMGVFNNFCDTGHFFTWLPPPPSPGRMWVSIVYTALKKMLVCSVKTEWEDNKRSLLEYIWTAHMGIKGMVRTLLYQY